MFLSRLSFHTLPGKTDEVEGKLMKLLKWVEEAGGSKPMGASPLRLKLPLANLDKTTFVGDPNTNYFDKTGLHQVPED